MERSRGGIFESVAFTLLQSLVFGKKSGGTFEGVAFTLLQRTKAFALPVFGFWEKVKVEFLKVVFTLLQRTKALALVDYSQQMLVFFFAIAVLLFCETNFVFCAFFSLCLWGW